VVIFDGHPIDTLVSGKLTFPEDGAFFHRQAGEKIRRYHIGISRLPGPDMDGSDGRGIPMRRIPYGDGTRHDVGA